MHHKEKKTTHKKLHLQKHIAMEVKNIKFKFSLYILYRLLRNLGKTKVLVLDVYRHRPTTLLNIQETDF